MKIDLLIDDDISNIVILLAGNEILGGALEINILFV